LVSLILTLLQNHAADARRASGYATTLPGGRRRPRLDILVNNAGMNPWQSFRFSHSLTTDRLWSD